ncbi:MAG TPA: LuxR C-terminal-related transcriptional regulator, partial [Actinotalea sp.]
TRVLSAEQILSHLDDRFGLLTGGGRAALPRHQTLRTAIDWSHDLLAPQERTLLRRLSVFGGRFTLEDLEGVCAPDGVPADHVLDLLSSLVDKSLVAKQDAGSVACYRLHETMREYAALKLHDAVEEDLLTERCAEYYVTRCSRDAEQARYHLVEWLGWLDLEIDNIRAVLDGCLSRADYRRCLALVGSLAWYWVTRATTEGVRRLDQLLALDPSDSEVHTGAHFMRGFLAVLQADPASAGPELDRAMAAARDNGQRRLLVEAQSMASVAANMAGDRESAARLLVDAQAAGADLRDGQAMLAVLQAQALHAFFTGDLGLFGSSSAHAEGLSRETGDLYTLEIWLMNQGFAALAVGDRGKAQPRFAEALRIASAIDDRVAQSYLIGGLGCLAAAAAEPRLAARLFGAHERLRAETGASVNAILTPLLARATAEVDATLGRTTFEAEVQVGTRYERGAAVGLALGETGEPPAEAPRAGRHAPLAAREAEVAHLVADGLTNKQIGTRLFISERTVENHVRSIMNKLGFSSRAQIAGWIGGSASRA